MNRLLYKYVIRQVPLASGLVLDEATPLHRVVEAMKTQKTGCVVTKKNDEVTGIFTERDLLTKVIDENVNWNDPIQKFTTKEPVTLTDSEPLRKALFLMRKKNFRHIPILNEQKDLVGILSIRNVIRLFAEHFPKEVMNLPPKLRDNVALTPEGG